MARTPYVYRRALYNISNDGDDGEDDDDYVFDVCLFAVRFTRRIYTHTHAHTHNAKKKY